MFYYYYYYYGMQYNTLELHYWIELDMHSMDAFVQNRCEHDFLELVKEIASTFNAEVIIETEPIAPGGLVRFFKIVSKEEGKKAIITTALITALATSILVTPVSTSIAKVTEKVIDKIFENEELKKLEEEKLKLEVEKLKQEVKINSVRLNNNPLIEYRRSDFYSQLSQYSRVNKVSFVLKDEKNNKLADEFFVEQEDFGKFQSTRDINAISAIDTGVLQRTIPKALVMDTAQEKIDNAFIEVTAPIFTKGKIKWKGIYEKQPISFTIDSAEFNELVQTGKIQFKKGTSINCLLKVKKVVYFGGIEKFKSCEVLRVNSYSVGNQQIETEEGKQFRLSVKKENKD